MPCCNERLTITQGHTEPRRLFARGNRDCGKWPAMALNDALDNKKPAEIPGVQEVAVWTTFAPGKLPNSVKGLLAHPLSSGYSLGACFAPSVSHPGGVYWVVMIVY